jgi:hypothetical protein
MEGKGKLMVARMELPKELYDHFIITSIKGNAPYFMIGFKNDEAFGKAMADAAKKLIYIPFGKNVTYNSSC